jgi:6-carboxyhexanoate--CoA ligase
MRAADGGIHEDGGTHISGSERLVTEDHIPAVLEAAWRRAKSHELGCARAINIRIDSVDSAAIRYIPPLPIDSKCYATVEQARTASCVRLEKSGISKMAAHRAMEAICNLRQSMRGAMVFDAISGERLDEFGERGVRISHMDCENEENFIKRLRAVMPQLGIDGAASPVITKLREALVLASKAAAVPGYAGELCWSDDPNYPIGYVASGKVYCRIVPMKELGSSVGGRVLFLWPGAPLAESIDYWQRQPVLVTHEFRKSLC